MANLLIHREYTNAHPTRVIIYRDRVEFENATVPHGEGPLTPDNFTPFAKNPVLSKFFIQLGRAEELGSGILNVNRLIRHYAPGKDPQFLEGAVFKTIVPVPPSGYMPQVTEQVTEQVERLIICLNEETLAGQELMDRIGLSHRPTFLYNYLQPSLAAGFIEMTIPDKPRSSKQRYRLTPKGRQVLMNSPKHLELKDESRKPAE